MLIAVCFLLGLRSGSRVWLRAQTRYFPGIFYSPKKRGHLDALQLHPVPTYSCEIIYIIWGPHHDTTCFSNKLKCTDGGKELWG
jgi:hypothetical protein